MTLFTHLRHPISDLMFPLNLLIKNLTKTFAETHLLFPLALTCKHVLNCNLTLHQLRTEAIWIFADELHDQ